MNQSLIPTVNLPDPASSRPESEDVDVARWPLLNWFIVTLFVLALVSLSYRWVDRPAALLAHSLVRPGGALSGVFIFLTRLPDLLTGVSILFLLFIPVLIVCRETIFQFVNPRAIILISSSFVGASAIKTVLKFGFGRTWPETWIHNNPSFIRDDVFGFFPLHGGAGWSSFPSGHMTAVMAVVAMAWQIWPRFALLWALVCVGAGAGLIILNLHFLSDVIAGAYIGCASASAVLWLWRRRVRANIERTAAATNGSAKGNT